MTETSHTRSRRAALLGLLLQVVVFGGALGLAHFVNSGALLTLAWFILGGVPIWFAALLVFRQRELAALEALDLEELRREKQASGAGEGIFEDESGGGAGYRVAAARLAWMQRWLLPFFGLLSAAYLAGMGLLLWTRMPPLSAPPSYELRNVPLAMVVLAVLMLLFFLCARYMSGLGRVPAWQLLRACGAYMLGNTLGLFVLIIALGCYHAGIPTPEWLLAYAFPVVMLVLAAEFAINFVLDIYRPRTPGLEPRASFDSRLLAFIAEPGGIASTIADAINYQFGFQVSQTWFYQLLQRTFVPLLAAGVVILWLLTCILVVQPGQSAIVERFGRQLNADQPYQAGFYWTLPWPIDIARVYPTGQLHQIHVGFRQFDAQPGYEEERKSPSAALWTDEKHLGQPHFDFLIPVTYQGLQELARQAETQPAVGLGRARLSQALPVNAVRMDVAVQYRIRPERLAAFTRSLSNPHDALRDMAWEEVVRYSAASDIFTLLGRRYGTAGADLKARLERRIEELDLGLEVVYVGVQNVHPAPEVSREFRKVVSAEQEMIASVREALVRENQALSQIAGDRGTAFALFQAINHIGPSTILRDRAESALQAADPEAVKALQAQLEPLRPAFVRLLEARWRLELAGQERRQVEQDFELGLGPSMADRDRAAEQVRAGEAELAAAEQLLDASYAALGQAATTRLGAPAGAALRDYALAQFALELWNARLEELLPDVQGQAAAILAQAQAERWAIEMDVAAKLARLTGERAAFRAAPRIYQVRNYLDVLVNGMQEARKFFLAFAPGDRQVRVHFNAEDVARPDLGDLPTRLNP